MAIKIIDPKRIVTSIEIGILKNLGFTVVNNKILIDEKIMSSDRVSVGKKSRNKGARFERMVVTQLSNWWSNGENKNVFQRTPRSGAWKFPEDIIPPSGCPFLISCKNREDWNVEKLLYLGESHPFNEWWTELHESLNKVFANGTFFQSQIGIDDLLKIVPMVIFTKNSYPNYVMIRSADIHKIEDFANKLNNNKMEINVPVCGKVTMLLMTDFLEWLSKEVVLMYAGINKEMPESD